MKNLALLLILIAYAITVKSQDLLNANKGKIEKQMVSRNGILRFKQVLPGGNDVLFYSFPKSEVRKSDINTISFFLAQDKCYHYTIKYVTDKNLIPLISKYDNPNSGFKRMGKGLIWINSVTKSKIEILNTFRNGQKISAFVLDVYIKR
jgi:hypothetical protein